MGRFAVLYTAPQRVAERFATATPAEAQAGLGQWIAWAQKYQSALVDPGKPLGNAVRITSDGVTPSDTNVIGVSIIQADTRDDALAMLTTHHHLAWSPDCEIILLEEMPIPELQA